MSTGEICHADSTDRRPQKVRVTAAFADPSGVVPTGQIEHVEFFIACAKPASSSTQGVDLIPENPFPTDE